MLVHYRVYPSIPLGFLSRETQRGAQFHYSDHSRIGLNWFITGLPRINFPSRRHCGTNRLVQGNDIVAELIRKTRSFDQKLDELNNWPLRLQGRGQTLIAFISYWLNYLLTYLQASLKIVGKHHKYRFHHLRGPISILEWSQCWGLCLLCFPKLIK